MKHSKIIAAVTLAAMALAFLPKPEALADGAASTRNIIIGTAAATLLIVNHNKKVHERYAEDAQKQAALAEQRDDAQAAAKQYKTAYEHESIVASNLKREVAVQQGEINKLQTQVASLGSSSTFVAPQTTAMNTGSTSNAPAKTAQVAVVSYGWGSY